MKLSKEVVKRFYEEHGGKECEWNFPHWLSFAPGSILLFKEKHGTRMFDASTPVLAGKACLKILAERKDEYHYDDEEELEPPAVPKEQAEALPESRAKDIALDEWQAFEKRKKDHERSNRFHAAVIEALSCKNCMLALALVFSRRDYEYEGVEEEHLEEVD